MKGFNTSGSWDIPFILLKKFTTTYIYPKYPSSYLTINQNNKVYPNLYFYSNWKTQFRRSLHLQYPKQKE